MSTGTLDAFGEVSTLLPFSLSGSSGLCGEDLISSFDRLAHDQ